MSKADNMLSILWMLRSGKKVTAQQLADKLEIHVRSVYRCIDALCASGAPIIADSGPNGGFQIMGEFVESPLLFDSEEQKALVHASIFAKEAGYPFMDALNRAIDKLKHYTNEKQLHQLEQHSRGISVLQTSVYEDQQTFLQILESAVALGQTLSMIYAKGRDGNVICRNYDPYGIVHWKGRWYTIGYCHLRREIRNFRVDRITQLELTDQYFEHPKDFSAKNVLLNQLLPDNLLDNLLVTVKIQGHEHVLNELKQHWLFGHAIITQSSGEVEFRLEASSLQVFVPYFLLPYGKALTIVEPEMLIMKMAEVSAGLAEHYTNMLTKSVTLEEN